MVLTRSFIEKDVTTVDPDWREDQRVENEVDEDDRAELDTNAIQLAMKHRTASPN
jgi:hypothetical protein